MVRSSDYLTIGQAASRCGVTASTLRFREQRGLIRSIRNAGNQRRYHRSTLRRRDDRNPVCCRVPTNSRISS